MKLGRRAGVVLAMVISAHAATSPAANESQQKAPDWCMKDGAVLADTLVVDPLRTTAWLKKNMVGVRYCTTSSALIDIDHDELYGIAFQPPLFPGYVACLLPVTDYELEHSDRMTTRVMSAFTITKVSTRRASNGDVETTFMADCHRAAFVNQPTNSP